MVDTMLSVRGAKMSKFGPLGNDTVTFRVQAQRKSVSLGGSQPFKSSLSTL